MLMELCKEKKDFYTRLIKLKEEQQRDHLRIFAELNHVFKLNEVHETLWLLLQTRLKSDKTLSARFREDFIFLGEKIEELVEASSLLKNKILPLLSVDDIQEVPQVGNFSFIKPALKEFDTSKL